MKTNKPETKELPKLYRVWSVVPRYEHRGLYFKDVHIEWCVDDREKPVIPYEDCIKDYDPESEHRMYPECKVKEFFTKTEADVLKAYLLNVFNDYTVQVDEAELPIPNNFMATAHQAFGGGLDCMMIYEGPSYCLGFKVCGVFDVRNQEPIGGWDNKIANEDNEGNTEPKVLIDFARMKLSEEHQHNAQIEYVLKLENLQKTGNLKLKIVRGNGYFEFPCDICRAAHETGHVYNLALDLPEDIELNRRLNTFISNFVCSECSKKIAPDDLATLEKLRAKVDASINAENELYELEQSVPSLVEARKKAQQYEEIPF